MPERVSAGGGSASPRSRHVAVIGSAGRTGREVVQQALAAGAAVTGLQRHPASSSVPGLSLVVGDATDPTALGLAVRGADLVVCTLGASQAAPPDTCSRATRALVAVLAGSGPARLVVVTGAMSGHPRGQIPWLYRAMESTFPALRAQLVERREQERAVRESGLRWTLVRPARLSDRARWGTLAWGEDLPIGLFDSVSRPGLAAFLVGEGAGESLVGRGVGIVERAP